jgi:hypothetical protein
MRSLLPLTTILLVWAVCFVIFAIAFTSILGLAPFSASQTWEMNFRSVPNSLVFLFMLSYGDEWPQLMNSVASVTSDHCLNNDGQCVNPTSVRALFTIWNILSMYFFANACTAIVYSHTPVGNALVTSKAAISAVSREDMRRFKIAWASLDPDGTGYVSREMFPRMLGVSLPLPLIYPPKLRPNINSLGTVWHIRDENLRRRVDRPPNPRKMPTRSQRPVFFPLAPIDAWSRSRQTEQSALQATRSRDSEAASKDGPLLQRSTHGCGPRPRNCVRESSADIGPI